MSNIYRSKEFSLSQTALDHVRYIQGRYLAHSPGNPPVLAGICTGYPLGDAAPEMGRVIIAFWTQAEVSSGAWNDENIVDIAGIKFLFAVLRKHRAVFLDAVIDYSPESAFFLRKTPTV